MSKSLIKDSGIYLIGEMIAKIFPFLLLPYLSRKLGVAGFGELSYYQTYLALFAIIIGLSQEGAVTRYFYFHGKDNIDIVVKMGYTYSIIMGGMIAIFCWLIGLKILFYGALSTIFAVMVSVQLGIRQCQKQSLDYTKIQILSAIISTVTTIAILELFQTDLVTKRIIAILIANILVFFIAYVIYRQQTTQRINVSLSEYKTALIYVFSFGVPLILHHLSGLTRGQMDRLLIYHHFDEVSLGIYAMGAQLALISSVLIAAINKATLPYYYEALKRQKINLPQIQRWALLSLLIVPIPSLIVWLIPESLFLWVLGQQFIGVKYYFVLFLLSAMLFIPYMLLVNYLFYHGKNKQIAFCSVLSTIIYLVLLSGLVMTKVSYIPFASIGGAVAILPILYIMTKKVEV